jgi:hypothetical protein
MNFPVFIYDINSNKVSKTTISKSHSFYFYSYQKFNVEIIDEIFTESPNNDMEQNTIFSVKQIGGELETLNQKKFEDSTNITNNNAYTLYIGKNKSIVKIKVWNQFGDEFIYTIKLELDNIIDESNNHYLDLLTNNDLPNYDELSMALITSISKSELIKRLLLDFKKIVKYKGSINSIKGFFQFLGFIGVNLHVLDEYLNLTNNAITTTPNKLIDTKTGNYHILYDNYTELGYDENNLPVREISILNIDEFFEQLIRAIALANRYFTSKEQDITFFGLNFSSNIANEPSITSHFNALIDNNIFDFRNKLFTNVWRYIDSKNFEAHIYNNLMVKQEIFRSETKTYTENQEIFYNRNLHFIDKEIFDDEVIGDNITDFDISKIVRLFGAVIHLQIVSPDTYVEFVIQDKNDPNNKLVFNKTLVTQPINRKIAIVKASIYNFHITIHDLHNNKEFYFYEFILSDNYKRIDFDIFNSVLISDDMFNINNISLDIDSPVTVQTKVSDNSKNYILPIELVPAELSNYYDINFFQSVRWLSSPDRYVVKPLNSNFGIETVTETINLEYIENWLDIVSFKYLTNYTLKIKVYDIQTQSKDIIDIKDIKFVDSTFDSLYVMVIDVFERDSNNNVVEVKVPYYFITTLEKGIDINKDTYDFVLVSNDNPEDIISVYDLPDFDISRIPSNFDFWLFEINSEIATEFEPYISETENLINIEGNNFVHVKSIFPRMLCSTTSSIDTFSLTLGDIILCRLNDKYVVEETDIVWKIFNSFTKELIFETKEFMLKYRIEENIIYDILCEFKINNKLHQILKQSVFSSFKKLIE